jgi:3'-phosphoadenosine 5'-phosphosulfate (PAPS) 3'-phosphatase
MMTASIALISSAHPMISRVRIRVVGRDYVAHPAEQAARTDPEARRDNEPQNAGQDATVIELSDSRDERAQDRR